MTASRIALIELPMNGEEIQTPEHVARRQQPRWKTAGIGDGTVSMSKWSGQNA